tara:strand:- start:139 stop:822 length:684 start_codon:yes stop_codon:yes gene_type:complete
MKNILKYDLFIFDFDGTIFDTEPIHYKCWKECLSKYINTDDININTYFKYYHTLDKYNFKEYLKDNYKINYEKYDEIYKNKCDLYIEKIKVITVNLINKIDLFINYLKNNNKKVVLVTNASINFIKIYQEKYEIMKKFDEIYTKENFTKKKPNPECYINIAKKYPNLKKICFEDSLTGFHSLSQVNDIDKIFINTEKYYYYNHIIHNYNNFRKIEDYDIENLNKVLN